jgi:hypothetical protein
MLLEVRHSGQDLEIDLTGEWRALELARIDAALAGVDLANARQVSIGTQSLTALDLSGAWRPRVGRRGAVPGRAARSVAAG